ncbi:MAG: AI-2E family transporter, partial [Bacteroidia bacterium]|nr:AI-2E family transporter [Bacteroidia bacterium]
WPLIQTKLKELMLALVEYMTRRFNLTEEEISVWIHDALNNTFSSSFGLVGPTMQSLVLNLAMLALIPIYAFLILLYRRRLVEMVYLVLPAAQRSQIAEVIQLSVLTYFRFIKGMALVYFIVGTLNSFGLWMMGIPYPFLFGYLTAVMTFIPYIGIMVSAILPIVYAWVSYGSIWYPLGVVALFTAVQYLEANVIFPWAVGQRLELNTLATLIVIVIGGIVWGASGMILFIPFAAILKLIADRMPGWEALSVFLGNKSVVQG